MSKKQVAVVVSREELVARKKRDGRNLYEPSAKRRLIEACMEPGVSISGMALAHGLNTNVLRKWLMRARASGAVSESGQHERRAQSAPKLLPVTLLPEPTIDAPASHAARSSPHSDDAGHIKIEIGGARIVVDTRVDGAALSTVLECLRRAESSAG